MKYVVGLVVILAALYFAPQIITSTGNSCQAFEAKLAQAPELSNPDLARLTSIVKRLSNGEIGGQIADEEYPNLPQSLGCVVGYYAFDIDEFRQ